MTNEQGDQLIALLEQNNALLREIRESIDTKSDADGEILSYMSGTLEQINTVVCGVASDAVANEGANKLPFTDQALNEVDGTSKPDDLVVMRPRARAAIFGEG